MGRYIIRRVLWIFVVLVLITGLAFWIFYVLPPGDPAVAFAGRQATPDQVAAVRHLFGLDKPRIVQFGLFVKHLFFGDQWGWPGFGYSFTVREPIRTIIYSKAWVTVQMAVGAAVVWMLMGVPIGILSAIKRRSIADRAAMGFALVGVSTPVFWLGLMSLLIFWNKLHWAPGTGYVSFGSSPFQWFTHWLMPWFVLAFLFAAFYARMVRGTMIEVMNEDYIRTARAKGLTERRVIMKHGLRPTLTPVVSMLGVDLGTLLGGAIVTERVFNLPGLGNYTVDAVFRGDLPFVLAVVVFAALAVTIANLLVDITYAYLDPRVRYA